MYRSHRHRRLDAPCDKEARQWHITDCWRHHKSWARGGIVKAVAQSFATWSPNSCDCCSSRTAHMQRHRQLWLKNATHHLNTKLPIAIGANCLLFAPEVEISGLFKGLGAYPKANWNSWELPWAVFELFDEAILKYLLGWMEGCGRWCRSTGKVR